MFFDLLHFGNGPQAINYFILCFFAILGTIQFVAIRYHRHDLRWIDGPVGVALSGTLIGGSFIWFFVTDQEIFIPGLAGGELFTLFIVAFILAIPISRGLAFVSWRAAEWQSNSQVEWRLPHPVGARNDKRRAKEPTL